VQVDKLQTSLKKQRTNRHPEEQIEKKAAVMKECERGRLEENIAASARLRAQLQGSQADRRQRTTS